ncbi:hypothetical protein TEA_005696 [Camellia sinensis var. sinensis]|uniref:Uncharacterized protein n=1 Tax=Camellia sinensis var. sinensis TaxID=542762 RepID=A0A4V3WL17_CAMSN|nr:hypothetical protein TEA_005696 [Camellia sinensis var. sinensis]
MSLTEQQVSNLGLHQFLMPNQQVGDMEAVVSNLGSQKISLPIKQSSAGEHMYNNALNEESNSENEVTMTPQQRQQDSQQAESTFVPADAADHASKNLTDSLPLKESCSTDKANDGHWS